jgi:hypothetical protein
MVFDKYVYLLQFILFEVVSKRQIAFESKAQADEKAQHTFEYVSILKRSATQLSDDSWGFENTSNRFGRVCLVCMTD